ncbi:TPA: hydroxymethylglutaryl-CoA reductase, partial [Candidatus Micrarchaeota archaeon]|nr:hydroxymethylglutaryl-CoA reductase [Candidatus Micrarchaeota archaeon]
FAKLAEKAEKIVLSAENVLANGDLIGLGSLMNENEFLLEKLEVVSAENIKIINSARGAGALGAKITGGGGGGCCIALAKDEKYAGQILAAIKKEGFDGFVTTVG